MRRYWRYTIFVSIFPEVRAFGTVNMSTEVFRLAKYFDPAPRRSQESFEAIGGHYGREIFFTLRQKRGFSHFVLRVGVEARKLSDHLISIGGRSLILDKKLYF